MTPSHKHYQQIINIGDKVDVLLPGGWRTGRVVEVRQNYGRAGDTRYEVHGDGFVTMTSGRSMRRVEG